MVLTSAQQQAVAARGNTLVMAGAGTGKTHTLVARLFSLLEGTPPVSLDEVLLVTFTEAAATEMRERISRQFKKDLDDTLAQIEPPFPQADSSSKEARNQQLRTAALARWQERVALLETAHIGTLHSFCLKLVRQHFYELQLDPQVIVMPQEDARLLAEETLEALLQKHYAADTDAAKAVRALIQSEGRGWDEPIRSLVRRLHEYAQTRPDPARWVEDQLNMFAPPEPAQWREWLAQGFKDWRHSWLPILRKLTASGNEFAAKCAGDLADEKGALAATLSTLLNTAWNFAFPRGKKVAWHKPLEDFLKDAAFMHSLACGPGGSAKTGTSTDPLAEDWSWVRGHIRALLELSREFSLTFTEAKRESGMVDFHDLEQYALQLLWDADANRPTQTALHWRNRLRFVFVDEYQDINAAQDRIIQAISREGQEANRFLVGDVKQSIYRFRLAEPRIFQAYAESWQGAAGQIIPLTENFRSREGILQMVNSLFATIMRRETGGVDYDETAMLRFGAPQERAQLARGAEPQPSVELHIRIKEGRPNPQVSDEGTAEAGLGSLELDDTEKEARLVALRLQELRESRHPVWDDAVGSFRPVEWQDMAVLLRSPSGKAESYAKEFSRLGVPLMVERRGFYESIEVTDLLSLLQMLDNPLQDLPVLAALRSPLVGLTLDELAYLRLAAPKTRIWTALMRWEEIQLLKSQAQGIEPAPGETNVSNTTVQASSLPGTDTFGKVSLFLGRFNRWRRLARQVSLSCCLESVLSETHYGEWLLTQPRGDQRLANVQRFINLALQFDHLQRQGLFRFLQFIEAQIETDAEPEVAAVSGENSVRLMSIHQSKGLEFPVVAVADLGKPFNTSDVRANIILDEVYGVCPKIKPPQLGVRYPSLPHWLAGRRQHAELLGEEMRLLYVAMTRARDLLVLAATVAGKKFEALWRNPAQTPAISSSDAFNYGDWLGTWFARNADATTPAGQGQFGNLRWQIHRDSDLVHARPTTARTTETHDSLLEADRESWQRLESKLSWRYPFPAATQQPAKTSVSALRRAAAMDDGETETSSQLKLPVQPLARNVTKPQSPGRPSAADIGTAHHSFLQLVSLDQVSTLEELKLQAGQFEKAGTLSPAEAALLNFEALVRFWNSEPGQKIRAQSQFVLRELPFTARFSPRELEAITGAAAGIELAEEFVVVQGVADLVVLLASELWVLDFKTDSIRADQAAERAKLYEPQLKLYGLALSRIYQRPVSNCWLYFLSCDRSVTISAGEAQSKGRLRQIQKGGAEH